MPTVFKIPAEVKSGKAKLFRDRPCKIKEILTSSEEDIEEEYDELSTADMEEFADQFDKVIEISASHHDQPLNKVMKKEAAIKEIVVQESERFLEAARDFQLAVDELNDYQACINARRLRASIEILDSVHPSWIGTKAEEGAEILFSGWKTLFLGNEAAEQKYLNNILLRHVYLKITAQALKDGNATDINYPDEYAEKVMKNEERLAMMEIDRNEQLRVEEAKLKSELRRLMIQSA